MKTSPFRIIVALFLAEMAVTFESSMIFAALPTLIREYGDPITAGWLVTAHLLVAAATYAVCGRLGDIRGRKQLMIVLMAISAVGSVMSAVTDSFAIVLVGRALQGFCSAVLPLTIGVIREELSEERVPVAVGLMTTASGAGVAVGLVLGGWIIDTFDWHSLFWVSAALLTVSILAVASFVPTRPGTPPKEPVDWVEGLLPAPGIMALLLGLSMSKQLGWTDPRILGALAIGLVILAYWATRSLKSREPFIDLRLLGKRDIAIGNLLAVLMAMGTANVVMVFSTYVQSPGWTAVGLGLTATMAGLAKLPSNILSFFAGPLSGWLLQKRGSYFPVLVGGGLAGTGWLMATLMPSSFLQIVLLLCWISFGTTLLNAAIPNIIVGASPPERTSEAIGMMSVVRGMFGAIGAQLIALALASDTVAAPGGGAAFPSEAGYRITMFVIAGMTLAAAASALLLRNRRAPAAPVPAE